MKYLKAAVYYRKNKQRDIDIMARNFVDCEIRKAIEKACKDADYAYATFVSNLYDPRELYRTIYYILIDLGFRCDLMEQVHSKQGVRYKILVQW